MTQDQCACIDRRRRRARMSLVALTFAIGVGMAGCGVSGTSGSAAVATLPTRPSETRMATPGATTPMAATPTLTTAVRCEGAIDFGTTTDQHGNVQNGAARQRFLTAYQQGTAGRWQKVAYTDEGDPISFQVSYCGDGTEVYLVHDTTRDRFRGSQDRRVVAYRCQELVEDGQWLRLTACEADGQVENVVIP